MDKSNLLKIANNIRIGAIEGVYNAKSGHPGESLSAADIFAYLYFEQMNIDPKQPLMPSRDRFVLSKGHVAPAYYAALAHRGYFDVEELKTLRKIGSHLQGHPAMQHIEGIDMSTGSLGQGLSTAVGMAKSFKMDNIPNKVYAMCGDGEIEEGQIWEAAMFAGSNNLDNLTVILDNNDLQIDGTLEEVCSPYPLDKKFAAFNFHVICIDGHDFDQIDAAFKEADQVKDKPTIIIAKTIKGKGVSFMENNVNWHGAAPNTEQYEQAMAELTKAGDNYE